MMNVLEADYGIGPLRDVEESIQQGIAKLFERNKQEPWFDGLWMNEYGEVLLGALYVACQAYCLGAVSDINQIRQDAGLGPLSKIDAYHRHETSRDSYSAIELLNAASNCFKHRDEWSSEWPQNLTTKTLAAFSITSASEFPINQVHEIIHGEWGYQSVCELVSEWRKGLIVEAKCEG
jgi:hypothetical protein